MEIKHTDNGTKGSFYIDIEDVRKAEMTYSHEGTGKIIIDHTEVDDSLKGEGVGYKLVDAAVNYSRENKLKVIATCPFVTAVFKKKSDTYADVLL